ncbi:MAG: twin-arginine translocation signal domain-containing protein [Bacteroidales bacterium]
MERRSFIKAGGVIGVMAGAGLHTLDARVPPHNWEDYDFGPRPEITDRLNQGPFSAYGPDATAPGAGVVMVTTPSKRMVHNFGMGMVTYICDEAGPPKRNGQSLEAAIEDLVKFDLGSKLYLRVDWRDIQKRPGKLDFPDHWKITFEMARKYNKRVGMRIQLMSPVIEDQSMPGFLEGKVPLVKLGKTSEIGIPGKVHYAPRYDHPEFMDAFRELDDLLSDAYNGHDLVEFVDTYMYGFWGEGHTWPFEGNPFPDYQTAENTSIRLFEHQSKNWSKTPLLTNTQPDYSHVGNSEVLDRTVRSHNWLRTDTIFIENEQIEALSNRPPWTGALVENGIADGSPESLRITDGIPRSENIIHHAKDVGPNYFSLWNWHNISAGGLKSYYKHYPDALDDLSTSIGYRIRPSWIWQYEKEGYPRIILGLANDGIAGVPGALRVYIRDSQGKLNAGGSLDPGYPLPGKIRQVEIPLPKNTEWEGLRLSAEIEVKNVRYPVAWACAQKVNQDGSITLKRNI